MIVPPLVYIAGPYRNPDPWQVEQNIRAAEEVGMRVAKLGGYPQIPHSNTRGYFGSPGIPDEFWLQGTLRMMLRCDAAVFLPNWMVSSGAREERREAEFREGAVGRRVFAVFDVAHLKDGSFRDWVEIFCGLKALPVSQL